MAHNDVVVHEEEEEDLRAAIEKLEIPFDELEQNAFYSTDECLDGLIEIIEDSNLLLDSSLSYNGDASTGLKPFQNPSSSLTASREWFFAAKRPRNRRGRPKKLWFKSDTYLIGSEVDVTDKSCLHCGTRNTPLWREGPKGPGTLCNACGMRYRTGRLLPEYRPASSPGFKPNVHSNFHRKVMKIRKEKNPSPNKFDFKH